MTDEEKGFQVAARGWCHEEWRDRYYPDDLPQDWRLAYYANEFRAVLVPADYWETADTVEVERWLEDTREEFTFYLEVADLAADWDRFDRLLAPLFPRTGGIVLRPPAVDADLTLLLPALEAIAGRWPVSLLLPEGVKPTAAAHGLLAEWRVDLCWSVGSGEPLWGLGRLAVAWVAGNLAYTPKEWREIIERCLRAAGRKTLLLVLEGEPPNVDALRAAMLIGDLLLPADSANEP